MQTITKIIERLRGDLEGLRDNPIKIIIPGFDRLCIEHLIVEGPRGLPMISIAHYYEQNGDLMADPDLTVEIDDAGEFHPVAYQQDNMGLYQEACFRQEGKTMIRPRLVRDLKSFMRTWNRNLKDQGFADAEEAKR